MGLNNVAGFLLLCISSSLLEAFTKEIAFTDQTYIKPFKLNRIEGKNTIQLSFKTIHPNGVLLYKPGSPEQGSYLILELVQGTVRCSGEFETTSLNVSVKLFFDDNEWHRVNVDIGGEVHLRVDKGEHFTLMRQSEEYIKDLTKTNPYVYVGSAPQRITGRRNFTGCMKNVRVFTDSDLLSENFSGESSKCCCRGGFSPVRFESSSSFLKFNVTNSAQYPGSFTAQFTFRTYNRDGVIFSVATSSSKLRFTLNESMLWCEEVAADSEATLVKLGSQLGDGEWHKVHVSLNEANKNLTVALDGKSKSKPNYYPPEGFFLEAQGLDISLGNDGEQQGFAGCLLDLRVNNRSYQDRIASPNTNSKDIQHGACELINPCHPNPCKHDGVCSVKGEKFTCTCGIKYEGLNCQDKTIKTTCHAYMKQGLNANASCMLGTDLKTDSFAAECRIEEGNKMYTIIKPTTPMHEVNVGAGNPIGDDFIDVKINYNPENEHVKTLKENSRQCEQTLEVNSFPGKVSFPNEDAYWKCGNTKILTSSYATNTNSHSANGSTKYTFLLQTDKIRELPVTSLRFHRRYSSSYFTVGPLRCFGESKSNNEEVPKDEQRLAEVCRKKAKPTPPPKLTTAESTVNHTPLDPRDGCDDSMKSRQGLCTSENPPSSTRSSPSNPEAEPDKWTDYSTNDELATALLSCSLVVVFLVTIKFGLPRCIVCVQTHSRSGEYVVASTEGTLNKKTTFNLINERRFIQDPGKKPEGKGTPRETPYWV